MVFQLGIVGYYKFQTVLLGFATDPLTREYWFWMINSLHQHPWTLWSVSTKGWTYLAAPYGLLWYILYYPIASSPVSLSWSIFLIDQLVAVILLIKRRSLFIIYQTSSLIMLPTYQNMIVLWFLVASLYVVGVLAKTIGFLLALVTKLPVGAPAFVWNYVLFSAASIHDRQNWIYYTILGFWGVWSLLATVQAFRIERGRHSSSPVSSPSGRSSLEEQTVSGSASSQHRSIS